VWIFVRGDFQLKMPESGSARLLEFVLGDAERSDLNIGQLCDQQGDCRLALDFPAYADDARAAAAEPVASADGGAERPVDLVDLREELGMDEQQCQVRFLRSNLRPDLVH